MALDEVKALGPVDVRKAMITTVVDGNAAAQVLVVNGKVIFVVGVPIPAVETQFFRGLQFRVVGAHLAVAHDGLRRGPLVTTLIGVAGGLWVTRRTVNP